MIVSVPIEMNTDHEYVISAASEEVEGFVTEELMRRLHGWTTERFGTIIHPLLQEGIVWVDEYQGETRYYFPSMWKSAPS